MEDRNIIFVYTNINGCHTENTVSFGLASIVSMAKLKGWNTLVLMILIQEDYPKVIQAIDDFKARIVAFTSVSSQFHFVKEISSEIRKQRPEIINVCGGVHTTVNADCIIDSPSFDGIFIGESEDAFFEFLGKVENGESILDTHNFAYNDNGTLKINPLNPLIEDFDRIPYPDKTTYPYIDTVSQFGTAPFMFSRGCPYMCSFCSNHAIAKIYNRSSNKPRYRSPESSIREIEETKKRFPQMTKVWIMDDTFGINKEWRKEFLDKYRQRVGLPFMCHLRANIVDEDLIKSLKDCGCYRILFGVESGNDHVRNDIMIRNMSTDQIIRVFDLCNKYGFETTATNIIGVPGETEEMIWDTIRLNRRIKPTSSSCNIFYPYRKTKLGDYCFENNLVNEEAYYDFSMERRESVLNYSEEHKRMLLYYNKNWDILVDPYNPRKRLKWILMKSPTVWNSLFWLKNTTFRVLGIRNRVILP
jgi:radical SAM superfamily enzyme YgiQ (UPF0313 family)